MSQICIIYLYLGRFPWKNIYIGIISKCSGKIDNSFESEGKTRLFDATSSMLNGYFNAVLKTEFFRFVQEIQIFQWEEENGWTMPSMESRRQMMGGIESRNSSSRDKQFFPGWSSFFAGLHRYVFQEFEQQSTIDPASATNLALKFNISQFEIRNYAAEYDLGHPIAGNFYTAQYSDFLAYSRARAQNPTVLTTVQYVIVSGSKMLKISVQSLALSSVLAYFLIKTLLDVWP